MVYTITIIHLSVGESDGYLPRPFKNDVFGQAGDFITSPEISQVFGEVLYAFPENIHSLPWPFTQTQTHIHVQQVFSFLTLP